MMVSGGGGVTARCGEVGCALCVTSCVGRWAAGRVGGRVVVFVSRRIE